MKRIYKYWAMAGTLFLAFSCNFLKEEIPETQAMVSFANETVSASASESQVNVLIRTTCDWTASSSEGWIRIVPEAGTSATRTISLLISENTVVETPRSGRITLTGPAGVVATLTVNQNAPAGPVPPGTEIYTAEDVKTFIQVAEDFKPTDISTVYNDIDMGGAILTPVAAYAGILDGQGHKIYNFKVESSSDLTGLFLENRGTIKNLVFGSSDGVKYDGFSEIAAADGKGGTNTALVAVNIGTIEDVTTFVPVKCEVSNAATETFGVAGLVGKAMADGEAVSTIRHCTNYAQLEVNGNPPVQTGYAGIVGYILSPGTIVESCTNHAEISISVTVSKSVMVAGVIGRSEAGGTYDKLVNYGEVSYIQKAKPGALVGVAGIVGGMFNGGVISDAVNHGSLFSDLLRGNRMGGILAIMNSGGMVSGAVNNGSVTLVQGANTNWNALGGIVASQEGSTTNDKDNIIRNCTNNAPVSLTVNNTTKNVYMNTAGGILGLGTQELSVTGNTNNGSVTATNAATSAIYAGGIYGALMNQPTGIESSGNVNTGTVSSSTSSTATVAAGGVVGYIAALTGDDANLVELTLRGEKSTGGITSSKADAAGAIAGINGSAKLENCIVGGSVNGVAVSEANFESLVQGPASKGTATGTTRAQ